MDILSSDDFILRANEALVLYNPRVNNKFYRYKVVCPIEVKTERHEDMESFVFTQLGTYELSLIKYNRHSYDIEFIRAIKVRVSI